MVLILIRPSCGSRRSAMLSLAIRSEEHTSELQSRLHLVCRLLLEKKKTIHRATKRRARLPIHRQGRTARADHLNDSGADGAILVVTLSREVSAAGIHPPHAPPVAR